MPCARSSTCGRGTRPIPAAAESQPGPSNDAAVPQTAKHRPLAPALRPRLVVPPCPARPTSTAVPPPPRHHHRVQPRPKPHSATPSKDPLRGPQDSVHTEAAPSAGPPQRYERNGDVAELETTSHRAPLRTFYGRPQQSADPGWNGSAITQEISPDDILRLRAARALPCLLEVAESMVHRPRSTSTGAQGQLVKGSTQVRMRGPPAPQPIDNIVLPQSAGAGRRPQTHVRAQPARRTGVNLPLVPPPGHRRSTLTIRKFSSHPRTVKPDQVRLADRRAKTADLPPPRRRVRGRGSTCVSGVPGRVKTTTLNVLSRS